MVEFLLIITLIVLVLLIIRGLNITVNVNHIHPEVPVPIISPDAFEDPYYDNKGEPKDKEDDKHSIDTFLGIVNGIMLGEEDNDAE